MKVRVITALAASLALGQMAVSTACAAEVGQSQAHFRTVERHAFSAQDLQRYGLSAQEAAKGVDLQRQGYKVLVMTPDEARQYHGGQFSTTTWLIIGLVAIAIVAIAAN